MKRLLLLLSVMLLVKTAIAQSPAPITGTFAVCVGNVTLLSDATAGGSWSSSNPAIAYVNPATGSVSGISGGMAIITYTVGGIPVTQALLVRSLPILTPDTVHACVGSTYQITSTTSGGGWTSSNTSVATVNFIGSVVAMTPGGSTITYTTAGGCVATSFVTVNPDPLPVTGTNFVYSTLTTSLYDLTPGGIWSTNNASLATVDPSTGIVTGVSAGLVVVSYTIPSTGCASMYRVEVDPMPGATDLFAWFPFCGDTMDHSGLGHNLLNFIGTPAQDTIDRFGFSHNAYYFSGGNCNMQFTSYFPNGGVPPDFTYSCWVNPTVNQSSIIWYNGNPNTDGFGLVMNDGTAFPGGAGNQLSVMFAGVGLYLTQPLALNTWHNIMIVKNGNSYRLYIDYVSSGIFFSVYLPMSLGSKFSLGGNVTGPPLPPSGFIGFLDDIAVLDKQLTSAERRSLYFYNPDARRFSLGNDTTICSDNITLFPNPQTIGGAYTWKTFTTGLGYVVTDTVDSAVIRYPTPGILGNAYSLTITKNFGCTASDTIIVHKTPIPVNLGLDRNFCIGDTITLTSSFPSSAFLWSNGDTTHSIRVTTTGNYYLEVDSVVHFTNSLGLPDSNVCIGRDTVYLHASTVPITTLPDHVSDCQGHPDTVSTIYNPGYTYLWSTGVTNDTLIITSTGTYWVKVTDSGCSRTDTTHAIIINQSVALISVDTAICKGDKITARASFNPSVNYQWTPTANMPVSNLSTVFVTPDTSAYYYLTVSYPGCPNIVDSFFVDVQPIPTVNLGGNKNVCEGDSIHITANISPKWYHHYLYNWTPVNGDFNLADTSTIVFTALTRHDSEMIIVKVYPPVYLTGAANQCYAMDSVSIFVHPKFKDTLGANFYFCPGDSLQLWPGLDDLSNTLGVVVNQAKWTPGVYLDDSFVYHPWIHPITSQTYRLIAYSQFGCADTIFTNIIVHPAAVINLGDSVILEPGKSYHIEPLTNCSYFLWYPPTGLDNDAVSNPVATPTVSTRYYVHASTEDGCKVFDSLQFHVDPGTLIDMPNAFTPDAIVNNVLSIIKHGAVGLNYFRIFDRWGTKVFETTNINSGWNGYFNGKLQPFGVYVYDIEAVTSTGIVFHRQGNVTLIK